MEKSNLIELEYMVRCSPSVLFGFLSTPSGLSEWFCDDVNVKNGLYTFLWKPDYEETAKLLNLKENKFIRYQWSEGRADSYFEFRIVVDEITSEVALIINDCGEHEDPEETRLFWNNAIARLHDVIGA